MPVPHRAARSAHRPAIPSAAPPLTTVAEIVHQGTEVDHSDLVIVCGYGAESLELGLWSIPPEIAHPTDVLVGWHAPDHAGVVGLVTGGEARSDDSIDSVRITVLTSVAGEAATVLERAGHQPETLAEQPQGWGADALRRCLGLPTPEPAEGLRACIEANWLRDLATLLVTRRGRTGEVTWTEVALAHPLHPLEPALAPYQLRALTATLEAESNWGRMARLTAATYPPPVLHPPGGTSVPLDTWFDAGSFARWSLRSLPDLDDLLFEVLDQLDADVATALLDALLSITRFSR